MKRNAIGLGALLVSSLLFFGIACSADATAESAEESTSSSNVAAKVGDRIITMDEVDNAARQANMKAFQALYDARRQALDQMISETLLESEASSRGLTVQELIQQEVTDKVQPVTDAEVQAFYDQNKGRVGGQTMEQVGPQIRQYLERQKQTTAMQGMLDGLTQAGAVTVNLEPPRVDIVVAANEMSVGPPDAKITIVEYSDFQ
jgi:hypothetical protein